MINLFNKMDKVVFLKESNDASDYIEKLKILEERANGEIKSRIQKEIKICSWGLIGEKNIAFELKNSGIPMYVLHDVSIEIEDLYAQIDFIVVTRKINFIIECKNLIGDIGIDKNGNFVREYSINRKKIKEGIYSPITQNQRHLEVLKRMKKDSVKDKVISRMFVDKYFDDFYKSIVVLSNAKTILNDKYAMKDIKDKVIRADQLNLYIKKKIKESKEDSSNDKAFLERAERFLSFDNSSRSTYGKKYQGFLEELGIDDNELKNTANTKMLKSTVNLSESGYNNNFQETSIAYSNEGIINEEVINEEVINDKKIEEKNIEEIAKQLKEFRLITSRNENIKPYFIFNDKQMFELIDKMPKTKKELMLVSGFGEKKVEKYGESILDLLL